MGIEGYDFTWSNRREDLMEFYPMIKVRNLIWESSDHFPLMVHLSKETENFDTVENEMVEEETRKAQENVANSCGHGGN
ncbi:High affinity cGMP-specific 3' 5'-cyclic phosphodiesterase 9A [Bienertia sinuspersici]